jgi:ankyrin repeat protein
VAARHGNLEQVKALVEAGVQVQRKKEREREREKQRKRNREREKKEYYRTFCAKELTIYDRIVFCNCLFWLFQVDCTDHSGSTPLALACGSGYLSVAQYLVDKVKKNS